MEALPRTAALRVSSAQARPAGRPSVLDDFAETFPTEYQALVGSQPIEVPLRPAVLGQRSRHVTEKLPVVERVQLLK